MTSFQRLAIIGAVLTLAISGACLARSAHAQTLPRYSIINLGAPGPQPTAQAVNDDYQVVGYGISGAGYVGYFWQPGSIATTVPSAQYLYTINNLGNFAGAISGHAAAWFPVTPYTTSFTELASSNNGVISGLTDDGYLAGVGYDAPGGALYGAMIYNASLGWYWSTHYASATGASASAAVPVIAYLVGQVPGFTAGGYTPTGGVAFTCAVPGGFTTANSDILATDAALDCVGYAYTTTFNAPRPMYFYPNNTTPAVPLPLLPHTMAGHALAINGACSYIGGDCSNRAVIWTGDVSSPAALVPTDTNTLTGPTSQWHLQTVTGINDQGAFVGNGLYGQKYVAYLAIPVTLASITLSSNQQTGAGQLTGTVTIDNPAPFDMTVTLTSFLAAATFTNGAHSTSVVIPQGTTNADFLLNCGSVSTKSSAYIRANYGGWDVYTKLVLVP